MSLNQILQTLFFSVLFTATSLTGQQVETKKIDVLPNAVIDIIVDHSEVKIQTWNKDYVEVNSSVSIDKNVNNDKHTLSVLSTDRGVQIKSKVLYSELQRMVFSGQDGKEEVQGPLQGFTKKNNHGLNQNMRFGYDVKGRIDIKIPIDMKVNLSATYGSILVDGEYLMLDARTTYGAVDAKLSDAAGMKHLKLGATYSDVDLSIEEHTSARFELNTTYGEVHSNLDLKTQVNNKKINKNKACSSGNYVLNDGATDIEINATYGDIYIKKIEYN